MKKKIKILYVIDHFDTPSGGSEGQLYNLIKNLDKGTFQPEVCLFRFINNYFLEHDFPCPFTNFEITSFRKPQAYINLLKLRKYIKERGYDIVQVLFNDAALSVPLVTAGLGVKTVATRRDMGFWYTPTRLRILRRLAPLTDAYLVNSKTVMGNIIEKERVPSSKVRVIYNAHNMDRFNAKIRSDFLSQHGIPIGSCIVGIVSNLRPVKRVCDLIRAFPSVLKECNDAYLVIVGDTGIYYQECIDMIRDLGIQDRAKILGAIDSDSIVSCMKWFNVGVLCSESEGLSNVIIEYMGSGVPVVATDIPSNRELIDNGTSGMLYSVGNIRELSKEVARLLKDEQLRTSLTQHSRRQITERFGESNIMQQYQEFYIHLARGNE